MQYIWHTMDEEPQLCGVILFSDRPSRIYDASYIGDGSFNVNGLIVDKSNFDCWCQRDIFFKETNLRLFVNEQVKK